MKRPHVADQPIIFRPATAADQGAIRLLLEAARLPTSDLAVAQPDFFIARAAGEIVGVGGVEAHGATGLLRSVAVMATRRQSGVGRRIVGCLEQHSRAAGMRELVLLTETAKPFFERLGYRAIERDAVPAAIRASAEFSSLCPRSAVCMQKSLAQG